MKGWLIFGLILAALAVLPLGVYAAYDEAGLVLKLRLGFLRLKLLPRKKKSKQKPTQQEKNKDKPQEEPQKTPAKEVPAPRPPKQEKAKKGGSLLDFLPLVKTALELLNGLRRKLRVELLYLRLTLAGSDPADLAENYGKVWASLGNLMPALERVLVIKKKDIDVACDFVGSETLVTAKAEITITLGRLLVLAVGYGVRLLKQYLQIQKKRKGGALQ